MDTVAFQSIGMTAALILCRLRNQQRIESDKRPDDQPGRERDEDSESTSKDFAEKKRAGL
jgi:hypothetical protein